MVYLVLTRRGLDELRKVIGELPSPLWVNAGVLAAEELTEFRSQGFDVSAFTSLIDAQDPSAIESAAATVRQHHSDEVIWVEYPINFGIYT